MKLQKGLFAVFAFIFALAGCVSQGETKSAGASGQDATLLGYKVDGGNITFTFNAKDYASFDEIDSVTVAGEFNGWDPAAADWQASDDDGDGIWTLTVPQSQAPSGSKFKFVTNEVDWMQPPVDKLPKDRLADDNNGGFNLILVY